MHVYPPKNYVSLHHRHELTDFQKGRVIEARDLKKSYSEICEELHIPQLTIIKFLHRFETHNSEQNLAHTGRPRKTSTRFNHYIIRTAEAITRIPFTELLDITKSEVSVSTLKRRLHEDHIRKWRAVKRALLTKEHVQKRLKCAR